MQDFNTILENTYIGKKTTRHFHEKIWKDIVQETVDKHTDPTDPKPDELMNNIIAKYK